MLIVSKKRIAELEAENKRLAQQTKHDAEQIKTQAEAITHLHEEKARLEETWKVNYGDLQMRHDKTLIEIAELLAFVAKVEKAPGIRRDKPAGRHLIAAARDLVKRYGQEQSS